MNLEEYIARRKKEDCINEFDMEKRMENTRICVNYIFEFFYNYLETNPKDEVTVLHYKKMERYRKLLRQYSQEVQDWILSLYSLHGKYFHNVLKKLIDDDFFMLYDSEAEFRALANEVYAKVIKEYPFFCGQSEMVFLFIKDEHRIRNLESKKNYFFISEEVNEWIVETYKKYGVNIYNFCFERVDYYYQHPEIWPKGHRKKSKSYDEWKKNTGIDIEDYLAWDYDYRQKNNLFGLNEFYQRMPKKSFIRGKKQWLEAVLMYSWLHEIDGDKEYWNEYCQIVFE